MQEIQRRTFLKGSAATAALLGAGSLGLSACSSSSLKGSPQGIGKPVLGGNLVIGTEAEEPGFNPATSRFDTTGVLYARTVFDPLAIINAQGQVVPYLAKSITPNADYSVWTITLRPNVYFHDGQALDASILKENLDYYKNYFPGNLTFISIPLIESVSVVDSLTVQVNMSSPWVPFDYYLAGLIGGQIAYVISPKMINGESGYGNDKPLGTGPFIFEQWVPNSHFIARKNPNYWRKGLPYLDSVEYRPITDETARLDSLESGTIDMFHSSDSGTLLALKSAGYSYVTDAGKIVGEPDMNLILINTRSPVLSNIYARQALAYATDQNAYIKILANSIELPSDGPFVPGTPYYGGPTGYPQFNLSKAKQAVEMYKNTSGQNTLSFVLGTIPSSSTNREAQFLQNMWSKAGINVSINNSIQQSTLISNAISGSFDAYIWRQFSAAHPDINYIFWSGSTIYPSLHTFINMAENNDPIINAALNNARANPNESEAALEYQTVAKRFAIDLPYIWLSRTIWTVAAGPLVENYNNPTTPSGAPALKMTTGIFWPTEIWKRR